VRYPGANKDEVLEACMAALEREIRTLTRAVERVAN
jgi:hypothetical protein